MLQKWEYMFANLFQAPHGEHNVEAALNAFGADGWELVSYHHGICVFKRAAPEAFQSLGVMNAPALLPG